MENHTSTLESIREARRRERLAKAMAVTAPSGAQYLFYRPTAGELLIMTGMLPQSLAAQIERDISRSFTLQDQVEMAQQRIAVLELVMVEPAVSMHPGAGELSILEIPESDREFAWKWAYGEIADDGSDLGTFPEKRRTASTAGPYSAGV